MKVRDGKLVITCKEKSFDFLDLDKHAYDYKFRFGRDRGRRRLNDIQ